MPLLVSLLAPPPPPLFLPHSGGVTADAFSSGTAVVTKEFLDFSASRGNNLRQIPGLDAGCKWCLCTARWKEAVKAAKGKDDPVVPKYVRSFHLLALRRSAVEGLC